MSNNIKFKTFQLYYLVFLTKIYIKVRNEFILNTKTYVKTLHYKFIELKSTTTFKSRYLYSF